MEGRFWERNGCHIKSAQSTCLKKNALYERALWPYQSIKANKAINVAENVVEVPDQQVAIQAICKSSVFFL